MLYQPNISTEFLQNVVLENNENPEAAVNSNFQNLNYTPVKKSEPVSYNFVSDESGSRLFVNTVDLTGQVKESVLQICKYEAEVELFGAKFTLSKEDGMFIITHDKFVISGEGSSIAESIRDLVNNIKFLKNDMANTPSENLDASGYEFKRFLFETILL